MNLQRSLTAFLCIVLCGHVLAQTQDMDKELSDLTEKLAAPIKDKAMKKVAVVDFTDLQGSTSGELGKYIAEQLTVNFVMGKRDFSVLDRANLKRILAEHKLTSLGLVDPENAKQLGKFAGVDALVIGTIIPKGQKTSLTAKVITTETAEIVGAARAEFMTDTNVQQLVSHPATEPAAGVASDEKPSASKTFGDLRIDLQPLRIVNDTQYLLTMSLTNQNKVKSIWVAVGTELMGSINGRITDSAGSEFSADRISVSGISLGCFSRYGYQPNTFSPATEIKPNDAITATVKFVSNDQKSPASGSCRLQLEMLLGLSFKNGAAGGVSVNNLVTKLDVQ
jgi:TolB-like protein